MPCAMLAHALCTCPVGRYRVTNPPGLFLRIVFPAALSKKVILDFCGRYLSRLRPSDVTATPRSLAAERKTKNCAGKNIFSPTQLAQQEFNQGIFV